MKKFVALLLALCMIFALVACGAKEAAKPEATPAPEAAPEKAPEAAPETAPEAAPEEEAAATWPSGPITIYSGYAVGSLTDVNLHTIADWIMQETGVDVIIESNDVGGGANLAAKLTKAEPDGLTLMNIGMNCISN